MAQVTALVGPYDGISTINKTRMQAGVPVVVQDEFIKHFPLRGAQDKVLARLFHIFMCEVRHPIYQQAMQACVGPAEQEAVCNDILNAITNGTIYTEETPDEQDNGN